MRISKHLLPVLIGSVLAVGLSACGDDDESETETAVTEVPSAPTDPNGEVPAAQSALEGVISKDIADPSYHVDAFRSDPAISPSLIDQIETLTAQARKDGLTGLDFDPLLCAQNIPQSASYRAVGVAGNRITFVGSLDFGGDIEKVTYVMTRDGDAWQLDSTECVDQALPKGG